MPASTVSSAMRSAESGDSSDGFSTTPLPQASATETRPTKRPIGPFQGTMIPATPSGSRTVNERWPGAIGICLPWILSAMPAQ